MDISLSVRSSELWGDYVTDYTAMMNCRIDYKFILAATLRWFTARGAIRIVLRQLSQTWKLRHYDVIDDVITRKL